MSLLVDALVGTLLGISLAAPPGPITSMIIRKATSSVLGALFIGFGAMTADLILLIITYTLHSAVNFSSVIAYVDLLGALFLVMLGVSTLRGKQSQYVQRTGSFAKGVSVGLINPAQIGWWLTAGLGFIETFGLVVFYFLFIGTTIWVLFLSYLVHEGARVYGQRAVRLISVVSTAILLVFAGYFLFSGLSILV